MNIMRLVDDPLLAARLVSVFAGFGAFLGMIVLPIELFKKKRTGGILNRMFGQLLEFPRIGLISGLLFVLYPFALVLDRMALYDALVACTMIWALYFEVLLIRYVRLDVALMTGAIIGSAVLTKTSGFFAIYLLPLSVLLFDVKQKEWRRKLVEWAVYAVIAAGMSYLIYSVLRLSPFFYIIDEKNALFVYPLQEWIQHPFMYLSGNFNALVGWFLTYFTIPTLLFALASFVMGKNLREKTLLLIWFLVPFVLLGFFGKTLYPRFIYFMTLPLLILAAFSIDALMTRFKNVAMNVVVIISCVFLMVWADFFIIFDISRAPIPQADLGQYINSWPAGGGVREMVSFFEKEAKKGKIYVVTQGTFGSLPTNSMEIYLGKNKNIQTRGMYPLPGEIPPDLQKKALVIPVYIVFNDSENAPANWPLTLISKHRKGIGDRHLSIYQVNP